MIENGHRSLERVLDIIELIAEKKESLKLSDIYHTLNIPKGSCFTLVKTLTARKYLHYDSKTATYSLGIKALEIGNAYLTNKTINVSIYERIQSLSLQINETVHLAVLDGCDIIYIMKHDSSHPVRMNSSIGKRVPAFATAVGKALMSQYSNDEIKSILATHPVKKVTQYTITDPQEILRQMEEIRKTSISAEIEESTLGIQCIGTALKNQNGVIVAGLSIAIPSFFIEKHDINNLKSLLLETADSISPLLGSETFLG